MGLRAKIGGGEWSGHGAALTAPEQWLWQPANPPFLLFLRRDGEVEPGAFAPNATLYRAELDGEPLPVADQATEHAIALRRSLTDFQLIDWEPFDDGFRLLAQYRQGEQMVTLEQWTRNAGDHSYILTFSVDTLDYGTLADEADELAASLRVG
jgi:hypothetical protein